MVKLITTKTIIQACRSTRTRKSYISPRKKVKDIDHLLFRKKIKTNHLITLVQIKKVANFYLMARHKQKYTEISASDTYYLPLYNELSKTFYEMHHDTLKYFKKILLKRKRL